LQQQHSSKDWEQRDVQFMQSARQMYSVLASKTTTLDSDPHTYPQRYAQAHMLGRAQKLA